MMKPGSLKTVGLGWLLAGVIAGTAHAQFNPFGGFGGGTSSSSSTTAGRGQPMGGADISFDSETRRLIVVTDDKTAAQIKEVVTGLDRPAPQVLIKVIFLEATYTKNSDIGLAAGFSHGNPKNNNTIGQSFGPAPITTLAGTMAQASPGGAIYSIMGQDFQATLKAIASAGKTEVLSRPSILARNNQAATISLGQQVPLITNTRFDNFGNQINTVTYQSVGVNLTVTPFISTDGHVEMSVTPEISSLADKSQWVAISAGSNAVSAPVINSRTATTTVVVPDGQTVVIGGLMENTVTDSEDKVPLLGDIPLLGNLFKHKQKENVKRELMIFLTPTIVLLPKQLAGVTQTEKANKEFAPKAFPQEQLDRFLEGLPMKGETTPPAPAPGKHSPK
ncbi:MAG: hypothetical protein EBS84_10235 [Proteobacteria bacterium]|nr:hypothetical protein [Verrucomicrobiota bacterium]NBU09380.1 hypothetical protein [Pseudomonadota bacterium]